MMKIKNNKIIECTEKELYDYWLKNWSDLFDYDTYRRKVTNNGTKVTDQKYKKGLYYSYSYRDYKDEAKRLK